MLIEDFFRVIGVVKRANEVEMRGCRMFSTLGFCAIM
jgi:hypothetical protein